jgi:hypothetical protein
MEMWNQSVEQRIAAAQARLLVERCQLLHRQTIATRTA